MRPNAFKRLSQSAMTRFIKPTADSSTVPEPIRMANSSALLSAEGPFCINFSRGRSSSAHCLMFSFAVSIALFIEILLESRKLILTAHTPLPPCTEESRTVACQLDKRSPHRLYADFQTAVGHRGIRANLQGEQQQGQQGYPRQGMEHSRMLHQARHLHGIDVTVGHLKNPDRTYPSYKCGQQQAACPHGKHHRQQMHQLQRFGIFLIQIDTCNP